MKIRRFVARDMRTALLEIKEELGADAVIMSNKKIPEGVELMAAVDYSQSVQEPASNASESPMSAQNNDSTLATQREVHADKVTLGQRQNHTQQLPQNNGQVSAHMNGKVEPSFNVAPSDATDSLSALLNRKIQQDPTFQPSIQEVKPSPREMAQEEVEQQFKSFTERLQQSQGNDVSDIASNNNENSPAHFVSQIDEEHIQANHKTVAETSSFNESSPRNNQTEMLKMQKEMASIRQLLEHQLSGLMWQDMAQKDPSRALLVDRLTAIGLTEQVADQIAGYVPSHVNEQEGWQYALKLISEQINTTNNDIIHRGGVVALVGPTGVGKTTTIAKLAARFAQIHGADQVAMISTDSYRIAGFEQLVTYGRIIGCQVKLAKDDATLDVLLQQYSKKKLVLIDTAGMGQRDMRLADHLTRLIANARVKIRNYLVLSANTQQRVMQENVDRFKKVPLAGCIYTKLDESVSVGEIISTSIQNGLPIGYLTDGQRVPEDIKVANAEKLVNLADKMSVKNSINSTTNWKNNSHSSVHVA